MRSRGKTVLLAREDLAVLRPVSLLVSLFLLSFFSHAGKPLENKFAFIVVVVFICSAYYGDVDRFRREINYFVDRFIRSSRWLEVVSS